MTGATFTCESLGVDNQQLTSPITIIEVTDLAGPTPSERIANLQQRVSSIEGQLKVLPPQRESHGLRNGLAAASLVPVLWWVYFITSNVVAIKQQLRDGGNKEIVASLEHPQSPAILRADLNTVIASIQTAQAKGIAPNAAKTGSLSRAIAQVIQEPSPPLEAWQAAGQLISYRTQSAKATELPTCKLQVNDAGSQPSPLITGYRLDLVLRDCTLVIDDPKLPEYFREETESARERLNVSPDAIYVHYALSNVHVVYSGRPIFANTIQMFNCAFEFRISSEPASEGKGIVEKILIADDLNSITYGPTNGAAT